MWMSFFDNGMVGQIFSSPPGVFHLNHMRELERCHSAQSKDTTNVYGQSGAEAAKSDYSESRLPEGER